jgi:hypothetical protein
MSKQPIGIRENHPFKKESPNAAAFGFDGKEEIKVKVQVHCYSGYNYAERPDSFLWQGELHRVQGIEKDWREPGERHFHIRTEDNKFLELCYNESKDEWSLKELG